MYRKITFLLCLLMLAFPAMGIPEITNFVIANEADFVRYTHKLYFADTSQNIEVTWTSSETTASYPLRGYHIEGNKYYDLTDLDNNTNDCLATFKLHRAGHWFVEVKACVSTTLCSDWAQSTEPNPDTGNPVGWWVFVKPAAPTGGTIE